MTDINAGRGAVLGVGALLADRMLTVTGADDVIACADRVSPATGGLVITGDKKPVGLPALAAAHPGLPLVREPVAPFHHTATAAAPFDLSDPDELFGLTLGDVLDGQRAGGASAALTPTGYIPPGDADPMKAAVEAANLLERDDTILWLPCHYLWAREPAVSQFIAIARRSRHPVAWSLADPQDPLRHTGVPMGVRRAVAEVPGLMLWRTDLAGIDALAHGALATAIGLLPSNRHITEPGQRGFASNPGQNAPHILITEMLRFVRANKMKDDWFASIPAPACVCVVCAGRAIDRFDGTARSRLQGHLHNLVELTDLHTDLLQAGKSRKQRWRERLDEARVAHQALEGRVSVRVPFPKVLDDWSKNWA